MKIKIWIQKRIIVDVDGEKRYSEWMTEDVVCEKEDEE